MKVLVVGAGMYVLGRGTSSLGTVLPALAQASKRFAIGEVAICSTSQHGRPDVERAAAQINALLGTALKVSHGILDSVLSSPAVNSFDCGIVCVPDHLHWAITRRLLEADLHCLVVKPFVPSVNEAEDLISLAHNRGLYGAVDFHKRFDEANLIVRRMLTDGRIGELAYATVEYSQRSSVPKVSFSSWASQTNIFQYLGVHYVDLLYFLTGYLPRRVIAVGRTGLLSGAGIETFDSMHVISEWERPGTDAKQFTAQFAIGWIDPDRSSAFSDQRFVLVGSQARVECDQKNRGLRLVGSSGVEDINPYFSEYLSFPDRVEFSGYGYRSIETFLSDVQNLTRGRVTPTALEESRPTFRNAMISTAVVQAARESLRDGNSWKDVYAVS